MLWAKQQHVAAANKSPATRGQLEGPVAPGYMPLGGFVGCCHAATYHSVKFGSHLEHVEFAPMPRGFASSIAWNVPVLFLLGCRVVRGMRLLFKNPGSIIDSKSEQPPTNEIRVGTSGIHVRRAALK